MYVFAFIDLQKFKKIVRPDISDILEEIRLRKLKESNQSTTSV